MSVPGLAPQVRLALPAGRGEEMNPFVEKCPDRARGLRQPVLRGRGISLAFEPERLMAINESNSPKQSESSLITTFVELATMDQIAPGTGTAYMVDDNMVAIFNVDGCVYAIDDSCLRCGGSLSLGTLCDHHVRCSQCDWEYEMTTGSVRGLPRLRTDRFEVKIVNSQVFVSTTAMPLQCDPLDRG
jgi:nitrite reductase/ring-hydroxylating ferredoxin subunit